MLPVGRTRAPAPGVLLSWVGKRDRPCHPLPDLSSPAPCRRHRALPVGRAHRLLVPDLPEVHRRPGHARRPPRRPAHAPADQGVRACSSVLHCCMGSSWRRLAGGWRLCLGRVPPTARADLPAAPSSPRPRCRAAHAPQLAGAAPPERQGPLLSSGRRHRVHRRHGCAGGLLPGAAATGCCCCCCRRSSSVDQAAAFRLGPGVGACMGRPPRFDRRRPPPALHPRPPPPPTPLQSLTWKASTAASTGARRLSSCSTSCCTRGRRSRTRRCVGTARCRAVGSLRRGFSLSPAPLERHAPSLTSAASPARDSLCTTTRCSPARPCSLTRSLTHPLLSFLASTTPLHHNNRWWSSTRCSPATRRSATRTYSTRRWAGGRAH